MTEEQKFRIQLEAEVDQCMAFFKERMVKNEEPPLENHEIFFRNAVRAMLWALYAPGANKDWKAELKRNGQWDQDSYNYFQFMRNNGVFDPDLTSR